LRDAFGGPVANAAVTLRGAGGATSTTDSRGRFSLTARKRGKARVSGKLDGFSATSRTLKVK
jgi:hypothetical protein